MLRSATVTTNANTRSTHTDTKQVRPIVTEAYDNKWLLNFKVHQNKTGKANLYGKPKYETGGVEKSLAHYNDDNFIRSWHFIKFVFVNLIDPVIRPEWVT